MPKNGLVKKNVQYSLNDYNDLGLLKPGLFMIILICYSARFLAYGPLSIIASRAGSFGSPRPLDLSFLNSGPVHMVSSLPAVTLLYLILSRRPSSNKISRLIWKYGSAIMSLTAISHMLLQGHAMAESESVSNTSLVLMAVSFYIFYYFKFHPRPKDVFSMFPRKHD